MTEAGPSRAPARPRASSRGSTSSYLAISGTPAAGVYELPSPAAMAELELTATESRGSYRSTFTDDNRYRGGGGLNISDSRRSRVILRDKGREGRKERHQPIDEEHGREEAAELEDAELEREQNEAYEKAEEKAKAMYARFSERKKRAIVFIVAFAGLLAPFCSSAFLPSIAVMSEDLKTTPTILNVTVAIFLVVIGISPLVWAPYSGAYGRKPIYLISLPIYTLGSMGVALSTSLGALIVTRIIQGAGSSAVLSVGAGTIGDLYPREERGRAMGLFYSGLLVGPALAPAVAGVMTEYVHTTGYGRGWRAMQWLLTAMGVTAIILVAFALPETSHTRLVDQIKEERREERIALGRPESWRERWVVLWVNPFGAAKLLARPHVLAISMTSSFILMSTYSILVPLSQTIAPRYNIHNTAILGCFFLAQGGGNLFAAQFVGRYADYVLRKARNKRNGVYKPEDRLKAALEGIGFILPVATLATGWTIDKAHGAGGLAAAAVLLFLDGVGLMCALTPLNTYCVDVMQHRSAEVIAVNNCVRYIFSAAASAFALPLIKAIGVGWTTTFSAFLVWIGFGLVLLLLRFGPRMRAWHQPVEEKTASTHGESTEEEVHEKGMKQ